MAAKTGTYTLIASNTLGSNQTSVTFSSIPGTYTDLVLVMYVKNSGSLNNGQITFNSDTATNYSSTYLQGNGSVAASSRVSTQSNIYTVEIDTVNWTPIIVNIMDYSNSTTYKTTLLRGGSASDRTAAWVGLWRNTNAITTVGLATYGGNFLSGSTFKLYGIEAGNL